MSITLNQPTHSTSTDFKKISADLQGNILSSHGRNHAMQVFIRFKDQASARRLLKRRLSNLVTSAKTQKEDKEAFKKDPSKKFKTFANISLSMAGYQFLGVSDEQTPTDPSFRAGQKKRAAALNDPKPSRWEAEYRPDWHALIVMANSSKPILEGRMKSLTKFLTDAGIDSMHVEQGEAIRNQAGDAIEHFGYVDGISQPQILTDKLDSGKITSHNWDPRAPLSITLVQDPGGKDDNSFGSYFIFRKLEQDVHAFRRAEKDLAAKLGVDADHAGAQMMGRFKSGVPLIPVSPPQPRPTKMNDFNFNDDTPMASKCPFHSHIRKTNPRGTGGAESLEHEKSHLFVRRGITYGGQEVGNTRDKRKVGLLFMAYNSNISNQFELMQGSWANNRSFPHINLNGHGPHGLDPIIGQGNNSEGHNFFGDWGKDETVKREKSAVKEFVKMRGGEYFFTPSISFLKSL